MDDSIGHVDLDPFARQNPALAAVLDNAVRSGRRLCYHGHVLEVETPVLRPAAFIVTFTPTCDPLGREPDVRLRTLLKLAARTLGLRAVRIEERRGPGETRGDTEHEE